jgi:alginate O-acetyltransferase complex protein AlgJ
MMKNSRSIYIIFSIILLTPCVLTGLFPDNSASIELRPIQDFPSIPKNFADINLWPGKFNNYANDHFILRGFVIKNISRLLYDHGIPISREVILGLDGWMFLSNNNDVINKYRGINKLSSEEALIWIKDMSSRVHLLKKRGIDCWLIIVPDKSSVYPQYLPRWCSKVGPSFTETLVQKLKEQKTIKWIDLRPLLVDAATKTQVYYKYGTHWNDYGSYLAYQYIIQRIHKDVRLSPLEKNEVRFIHKYTKDMHTKDINNDDLSGVLGLNDFLTEYTQVAEVHNTKVIYKIGNQDWLSFMKDGFATITSSSSCRAVILCDSYVFASMQKYLQETFSYTYFKHHITMEFDEDLILKHHPDVVLYIVVERLIPSKLQAPNH